MVTALGLGLVVVVGGGGVVVVVVAAAAAVVVVVIEVVVVAAADVVGLVCLLYTSPSPRDGLLSRMPSSA